MDDPIGGDLACFRCGYNLRGLGLDGVCPECGVAIADSFIESPFDCDHNWVRCMRSSAGLVFWGLVALVVFITVFVVVESTPRFNSNGMVLGNLIIALAFVILFVTACACQLSDHVSEHVRVCKWCIYFLRSSIILPFLLISFMVHNNVYPSKYMWHTIMPYLVIVVFLMQLAVPAMLAIIMRELGRIISSKAVTISNWIIFISIPIPAAVFVETMAMFLLGDFETSLYRWARNATIPIVVWSILVSVLICWLMVELRRSLSKIMRMLDYHHTVDAVV